MGETKTISVEQHVEAARIAATYGCDPRTALRALLLGPEAMRGRWLRERIRKDVEAFRARAT